MLRALRGISPGVVGYAQATLLLGTAVWCLAIFSAPLFHLRSLYAFFSLVCHQLPDRSWHLHGEPLAVCIRCTAISLGFVVGLLVFREPDARRFSKAALLAVLQWLLAVMILDSEFLRAFSGILLGLTAAPIIRTGVEELFTRGMRTAHDSM